MGVISNTLDCPSHFRIWSETFIMSFPQVVLAVGFFTLCTFPGRAENCSFLGLDPLTLMDRQVYVQQTEGQSWALLDRPLDSFLGRTIKLAYVFREQFKESHSGVIVVKSGRNRRFDEPQRSLREKTVDLIRAKGEYCNGSAEFSGSVTAKSYDDYHDKGIGGGQDLRTLNSFHAGYIGRRKKCKQTNDNSADSLTDPRSNRGQFSFDPSVVSERTYDQVAAAVGFTTALATSENLEDQRVEIKQYETVANMPSCLRIDLPAQKRSSFLRINDLEGLMLRDSSFVRANEKHWPLLP